MHAAHATEVPVDPSFPAKRLVRPAVPFASALRDGLADIAYAFDGAFRPAGTMSLAECASYGLFSHVSCAVRTISPSPPHQTLRSGSFGYVLHDVTLPALSPPPAGRDGQRTIGRSQTPTGENVRRAARLRRASSPDAKGRHVISDVTPRPRDVRVRACVGRAKLDAVVSGAGRLASVMQWMR